MTGVVFLDFIHSQGRARVEALENRVAIFGNAYLIQFGNTHDSLGASTGWSLVLPLRLPLRKVEAALMSKEEADAEGKGQRCNGFFLRPVTGKQSSYVLLLPPSQLHRIHLLRDCVATDPLLESLSISPFATQVAAHEVPTG